MTIDPFRKHYRNVKLLRLTKDFLTQQEHANDSKSLILVEGIITEIKVHSGLFTELLLKDNLTSLKIPVVTFNTEKYEFNEIIMCVGFVHFDWLPDYRCIGLEAFKFALKAEIIKRR